MSEQINDSAPRGGKSIYGATLAILMLDTRFPRILGDIGNADTWPFPVLYKVVGGATSSRVVHDGAAGLKDVFIEAAKEVVALGADGIGTTCGFLSLFQEEIAAAAGVPVATSSLMQVPWVQALLPAGKRVGVITVSAESLTPAHLEAAGVPLDTPVVGTEGGREFTRVMLEDELSIDVEAAREDLLAAGRTLVDQHDDIGALVLECANMGPFARDLNNAFGLPVFDVVSFLTWVQAGLRPRRFRP
jgi:hypothetical protein